MVMEPVDSVAVYGDGFYKGLGEILIQKQHMDDGKSTRNKKQSSSESVPKFIKNTQFWFREWYSMEK